MKLLVFVIAGSVGVVVCLLVWRLFVLNGEVRDLRRIATQQTHTLMRVESALDAERRRTDKLSTKITIGEDVDNWQPSSGTSIPTVSGQIGLQVDWNSMVQLTSRRTTNEELNVVPLSMLRQTLGDPVEEYSQECSPPTNPEFADKLATENVGPFRVRMLKPAIESLRATLALVKEQDPTLFNALGNLGAYCARGSRPKPTIPSSHSFGIAVDITINGHLDQPGDQLTQAGLVRLAEYFFENGWVWGASFGVEDSMHFEVGRRLFQSWRDTGKFK
jgi:hypothetical protein